MTLDMGKGDKKTKKGKITLGTFGVRRPKKAKKVTIKPKAKKAAAKPKEKKAAGCPETYPKFSFSTIDSF